MKSRFYFILIVGFIGFLSMPLVAQDQNENILKEMKWRNIGPANFSGRIVDVEALDNDFTKVIAASASGGVWKSNNAGITWEPIFDNYGSASIGDIAIFQKDPNIIWIGTGEANNRNSVAWGDGIYKSTDGGKSFTNMGLKNTFQISRVVTHPKNKDIAYVAAIGSLWGFSGDRGLFKTTDGGRTWKKLTNGLPDDEKTGAIDLIMNPKKPNTLYVAMYERLRKPYRFDSGGPNGGIFKSTNGGKSWKKLTKGLPDGATGRIGLDIHRNNPNIIVAIVEHGFQPKEDDPDYNDMSKLGTGIYRTDNGGKSWKFLNRYNNRPFYYSQIRINPIDPNRVYVLSTTIRLSDDGGKTLKRGGLEFEGGLDYHALWIDPNNKDRYYLGKDKGLTLTHDHDQRFMLFDNIPVAQFYTVGVDMRDPYYVYGGTQDNGTWGGPSFTKDARGILNDRWWKLHWGDGMFIQVDPTDWRKIYTEAEGGSFRRYNGATREVESSRPGRNNITNYNDFLPQGERNITVRYNWRAPLVMSPHNPMTIFLGGNHLFKTVDGGISWQIISPDLSTNDTVKTNRNSGGLTPDVTGAEVHCSITAFSQSPIKPGVLWVGTDDGNVQVTLDGGTTWENVRNLITGVPEGIWVSSIEASHFEAGRCYLSFDGHRSDNYSTWIYKTDDYGKTWQNITMNLPEKQPVYVVKEDLKNKDLLFAGTEFACFVSLNRGEFWTRLMNNMPTVAFHDLVIHPRDGDLIAGTHGRSFWILDDITPLQQLNDEIVNSQGHLFTNRPATIWEDASRGGVKGHFYYAAENPPYIPKRDDVVRAKLINGAMINYYLGEGITSDPKIEISDITGENKKTFYPAKEAGVNRLLWDMYFDAPEKQKQRFIDRMKTLVENIKKLRAISGDQVKLLEKISVELENAQSSEVLNDIRNRLREEFSGINMLRRSFGSPLRGKLAEPGVYLLKLTVDDKLYFGKLIIRNDPLDYIGK